MKDMSYRDKMVILVISIIVILVAGFFALIKPKYDKLVTDTNTYETTKTEWDGIKQKLDAIPKLKETITGVYNDAKSDASIFVNNKAFGDEVNQNFDTRKANYIMDQYVQPALDESNLQVTALDFGTAGTVNMEYYYYAPNVVTYSLLEAADVNGNYAETLTEELLAQTTIEEKETAEMLGQNIALKVTGTKENLMTFLEAMKSADSALNVEEVKISDYQFMGGVEEGQPTVQQVVTVDEEGNEVVTEEVVPGESVGEAGLGTSEMELSITFYNAKEIDVPDLGD
ncbi:MAG: hypothetical protein IIZ34_05370 [Eubacterium sp.]|nr:hypothetical protein [Eubacterium sp.]